MNAPRRPRDGSALEIRERIERLGLGGAERFDRVAFTMRALRALRPSLRVAVYRRHGDLVVDRGLDPEQGLRKRWAVIGVPPDASRYEIAERLAELVGAERTPLVIELLIAAGSQDSLLPNAKLQRRAK